MDVTDRHGQCVGRVFLRLLGQAQHGTDHLADLAFVRATEAYKRLLHTPRRHTAARGPFRTEVEAISRDFLEQGAKIRDTHPEPRRFHGGIVQTL